MPGALHIIYIATKRLNEKDAVRFFTGASLSLRWLRMTEPVILSEAKDLLREHHSMIEKIKSIRHEIV